MAHDVVRKWILIDPVTAVCYIRTAGLMLDVDLALKKKHGAHRLAVELKCGAYRLALEERRDCRV